MISFIKIIDSRTQTIKNITNNSKQHSICKICYISINTHYTCIFNYKSLFILNCCAYIFIILKIKSSASYYYL